MHEFEFGLSQHQSIKFQHNHAWVLSKFFGFPILTLASTTTNFSPLASSCCLHVEYFSTFPAKPETHTINISFVKVSLIFRVGIIILVIIYKITDLSILSLNFRHAAATTLLRIICFFFWGGGLRPQFGLRQGRILFLFTCVIIST